MKLEFGNIEHIKLRDDAGRRNKLRMQAFKRSGLTMEQFEIKEELRYWMNPTKTLYN